MSYFDTQNPYLLPEYTKLRDLMLEHLRLDPDNEPASLALFLLDQKRPTS